VTFVLLAFDTSSAAVTAALHDGTSVVAEHTTVDPLRHGEVLAPAIAAVLRDAGITAGNVTGIAVGVGPGPFTGLRVGVVTARVMGTVLDVPVLGICSLDVVAAAAAVDEPFLVATDARRREVYWAQYSADGSRVSDPAVDAPASVVAAAPDLPAMPVAGRGAVLYPDAFPRGLPPEYPSAADLARLAVEQRVEVLPPEPLYLRRPDIAPRGRPKRVS
jgi:tRNA threonylcarbamoyladenosine biosynthesis protein TsaB